MKKILRKIFLSIIAIYSLDLIFIKFGFFIPINIFSIFVGTTLGVPGLLMFAIIVFNYF